MFRGTDAIATLEAARSELARGPGPAPLDVRLVVLPYAGPKARSWAAANGVSWADLSGNADIRADGLRVRMGGEANKFTHAGRPSNAFTPSFSRVSRALLVEADRWWKQRELAAATKLPSGTVTKAVQRLGDLLVTNDDGQIRARVPSLLLDAWAQRYDFRQHELRRYHAVGRSGPEVLQRVAHDLEHGAVPWAATGLSAAWMYTQSADFRINSFYVTQFPSEPESMGLRPVASGENVWLLGPRDEGVLYGKVQQRIWCAHPVQVYLDLLAHPERAKEAAESLRSEWMRWRE